MRSEDLEMLALVVWDFVLGASLLVVQEADDEIGLVERTWGGNVGRGCWWWFIFMVCSEHARTGGFGR